jgi:hypothetical protein
MHVNAKHGSVFGFKPNLKKNPNSGTSKAVASNGQEEVPDSEPHDMGFVVFLFSFLFFYLTQL